MNTFLIIYLGILLFEAILSTILKYAWQAEDKWNEPFYNQKTEQERNSSQVSHFIPFFIFYSPMWNGHVINHCHLFSSNLCLH